MHQFLSTTSGIAGASYAYPFRTVYSEEKAIPGPDSTNRKERAVALLAQLYDEQTAKETAERIWAALPEIRAVRMHRRNETMLITYADSLQQPDEVPLQTLKGFLDRYLHDVCGRVHLLPFYPSSSDDGFAVIDYRMVDHHVGTWTDIEALAEDYDLMFDFVINHCSRENLWFADFVGGRDPGRRYFITLPEESDTSAVARPRSTPLISPIYTYDGIRHVWNTFSDDQIDLDFSNVDVLCEFIDILLFYVERGARLIRLDAVGYIWKRLGTSCLNLPEAHVVVQLLRLIVDHVEPGLKLITETNVPHDQNIAYFGAGDEAHMVYQFSLAPLLLHAFAFEDSGYLQSWASTLEEPPRGAAYLNFIASHDGIGMRPLEGLVPDAEIERLVDRMHDMGGFVTLRDVGEGQQKPYEINIALMSAFGGRDGLPAYLAAHALCLSFQGTPAIYIHSFLGTLNDLDLVEQTGRTRSINRRKWQMAELQAELDDEASLARQVLEQMTQLVRQRNAQPAFASDARQKIFETQVEIFALERRCDAQTLVVVANVTNRYVQVERGVLGLAAGSYVDRLSGGLLTLEEHVALNPHQVMWLDTPNG